MTPDPFVQGDKWTRQIVWCNPKPGSSAHHPQPDLDNPVDITGWTARLQFRRDSTVAFTLTSATGGGLVITGDTGTIVCAATPAQTELLIPGTWGWELELSLVQDGTLVDRQTIYTERLQVRRQVTTP
ncbi:MAG: hypothetical protein M3N43_06635 [Actinomycetota bacterium]|nr:hypothetical protein [Actinomycetota bacterium]